MLTNNGGPVFGVHGYTYFFDNASAGTAVVVNNSGYTGGQTIFFDNSTAADATIIANGASPPDVGSGFIGFGSAANAGNATLIANAGATYGGFILLAWWGFQYSTSRDSRQRQPPSLATIRIQIMGSIGGDGEIILAVSFNSEPGSQ